MEVSRVFGSVELVGFSPWMRTGKERKGKVGGMMVGRVGDCSREGSGS